MSEYSKLSFEELFNLPYSFYLLIRKDSWIDSMRRSEEGEEILKKLWRLQQKSTSQEDLMKIREVMSNE